MYRFFDSIIEIADFSPVFVAFKIKNLQNSFVFPRIILIIYIYLNMTFLLSKTPLYLLSISEEVVRQTGVYNHLH